MCICKFYASTQADRITRWNLLKAVNTEIIPNLQATFQSEKGELSTETSRPLTYKIQYSPQQSCSRSQLMSTAIPLCKPLNMDFRTQMPGSKVSAWNLPCPPYPCRAQPCTGMCAPKSHWNPTGKRKPSRKRTSRNAQWPWTSQRLQNSLTMEFLSLCILLLQSLKLPHWGSTALSHKLCMFLFTYSNQLLRILWSKRKIIFF